MSTINPQLPYYIAVYVLTIVLRLIKVYRERPKPEGEDKNYLFNYLYFGFDLVNVSAGVVILLSEYAPKYFATIFKKNRRRSCIVNKWLDIHFLIYVNEHAKRRTRGKKVRQGFET